MIFGIIESLVLLQRVGSFSVMCVFETGLKKKQCFLAGNVTQTEEQGKGVGQLGKERKYSRM